MGNSVHHNHNLINGTGRIAIAVGAASLAQARAIGWAEWGNCRATTLTPSVETDEHSGSYDGVLKVDKKITKKVQLAIKITFDECPAQVVALGLMGTVGAKVTQAAITSDTAMTQIQNPARDTWYDLYASGVNSGNKVRDITSFSIATNASAVSVTYDTSTDVFTASAAHGFKHGNIVKLGGTPPTGFTTTGLYYVLYLTDTTFKLSASEGGVAIEGSTTGTTVTATLTPTYGVDVTLDAKVGCFRFNTAYALTVTPTIQAAAITEASTSSLRKIVPLNNPVVSGYARLLIEDTSHPNLLVREYEFSCDITSDGSNETNGSNTEEYSLTLTVSTDPGTLLAVE